MVGYSVGSGLAARAAQKYGAKRLILIAPYFSLEELAREKMPFVPKFLIKYKIPTFEFVGGFGGPVTIFHGEHDELIGVDNSRRLLKFLKPGDKIYELNAGHNDILGLSELWGKISAEARRVGRSCGGKFDEADWSLPFNGGFARSGYPCPYSAMAKYWRTRKQIKNPKYIWKLKRRV